tara:strand:- start:2479 stop:2946 length:468 start_codon:yes stop_codon:yes gene_type:complete
MSKYISKQKREEYSRLWRKVNRIEEPSKEESLDNCLNSEQFPDPILISSQEDSVKYSSRVLDYLRQKMKNHNKSNEKKVSLGDLIGEFRFGAKLNTNDASRVVRGLSYVNQFLGQSDDDNFSKAKKETLNNNLNFDFEDIDDLYIEKYEKIHSEW